MDNCLGGFYLTHAQRAGLLRHIAWDFAVPGVTSISIDVHKYGMSAKGASVCAFRDPELRRRTFCPVVELSGSYATPTFAGSRPGSGMAAAWATMVSRGEAGYTVSAVACHEVRAMMVAMVVVAAVAMAMATVMAMVMTLAMIFSLFCGASCSRVQLSACVLAGVLRDERRGGGHGRGGAGRGRRPLHRADHFEQPLGQGDRGGYERPGVESLLLTGAEASRLDRGQRADVRLVVLLHSPPHEFAIV